MLFLLFVTDQLQAQEVRFFAEKLENLIPRQQFKIPLQASIGGK